MKISYAITVCNELDEIKRLINFLLEHKREEDEIVVLQDSTNFDHEVDPKIQKVYDYLEELELDNKISFITYDLNNDFASFKNKLINECVGDYIFNIDADEIPHENLIKSIHLMTEANPGVDLFLVPRVNTVEGITQTHINKWRWQVNDKEWINWPDFQTRIFKNTEDIRWEGKVHERITNLKEFTQLPLMEEFALYHPKTIEKQEKQNDLYDKIESNGRTKYKL